MTFREDLVYPKMSDADEKATPRSSRGSAKGGKDDKDDMDLQMQDINSDDKGVPPKRTSGWGDTTHADTSRSSTAASEGGSGDAAETKRGRRRKEEKAEAAYVQEDDDAWDFDSLLRDVFQDVQKEQDEKDNQDEAEQNAPAATLSSAKASVAP
ncbi:hypothetical protein DYB38_001659 [Aphanomyces astaci]|uniref:Uncharacterized protein n=1 Tax=Aphanomyces astaci TaxID=112090 RepID=A0A397DHR1_APHAT|nr:hypothetical protein DYB34_000601 [Aphanomyces astaci]RHY65579.1 hypothetical protein DYB38_001659 [Aphanomyces astaci]